jgi:hypothetical protein
MKQYLRYKLCYLTTILLLAFHSSYADHIAGGDISYSCTNVSGVYHITFTVYRDCSGVAICTGTCDSACSLVLNVSGTDPICNGVNYGNVLVSLTSVREVALSPYCPGLKSICTVMGCTTPGTYTPGIERYQFEGTLDFNAMSWIPASCCNVRVSWSSCCRSAGISTGSTWGPYYTECILNRCVAPCNSSPVLTNDPLVLVCGGQPVIFNNGAIDPDQDSLSYALVPALQSTGAPVTYNAPYSGTTPMPYYPPASAPFPSGFHCDNDGNILFTPTYGGGGQFVGVVAVQIKQWKRIGGIPMNVGTTMRDMQLWLITCPANNIPRLKTIAYDARNTLITNASPSYLGKTTWTAFAGQQLCFDIVARDTDFIPWATPPISDTTYLSWNAALAQYGATFTKLYTDSLRKIAGPRQDSMRFCWTPDSGMVNPLPYYFTVHASDSRCPMAGRMTTTYAIMVLPAFSIAQNHDGCYRVSLSFTSVPASARAVTSSTWTVSTVPNTYSLTNAAVYSNTNSTPYINFTAAGKYLVKLNLNYGGNINTYYDTIRIDTPITAFAGHDTIFCGAQTTTLHASGGQYYQWRNLVTNSSSVKSSNPDMTVTVSSSMQLEATIYAMRGGRECFVKDTVKLGVSYTYPVLTRPAPRFACSNDWPVVLSPFTASPAGGKGIWYYPQNPYALMSDPFSVVITDLKNLPPKSIYTYADNWIHYTYWTDSLGGCPGTDSALVRVYTAPDVHAGNPQTICSNSGIVQLTNNPYLNFSPRDSQYAYWSGKGVGQLGNSTFYFDPLDTTVARYPMHNTITYTYLLAYSTPNTKNCYGYDTVDFDVHMAPVVSAGSLKRFCSTDSAFDLTTGQVATPTGGTWSGNTIVQLANNYFFRPATATFYPAQNDLTYRYTDGICSNTDEVPFIVYTRPATPVISGAGIVNRGQQNTFSIPDNTSSTYNWSVTNGTITSGNGTHSVNAAFHTMGTGNINVVEILYGDCRSDTASRTIMVNAGLGMEQQAPFENFHLYPNPTTGFLNITFSSGEHRIDIEIIDILGKVVKASAYEHHSGTFRASVDLNALPRGVYFVKVKAGTQSLQNRVTLE